MNQFFPSAYERLGVLPSASAEDIRKNYRSLSKIWHPDAAAARGEAIAPGAFEALSNAYELVGDDEARRAYDTEAALWADLVQLYAEAIEHMLIQDASWRVAPLVYLGSQIAGKISELSTKLHAAQSRLQGMELIRGRHVLFEVPPEHNPFNRKIEQLYSETIGEMAEIAEAIARLNRMAHLLPQMTWHAPTPRKSDRLPARAFGGSL